MEHERFVNVPNGHPQRAQRLEILDTIVIGREQQPAQVSETEFEVVGIVEDSASFMRYAVCYSEPGDEFMITDDTGVLLTDESLAQEILQDFLEQAGGADEEDR